MIGDYCEKRGLLLQDLATEKKKKRNNAQEATDPKVKVSDGPVENKYFSIATGSRIEKGSLSQCEYGRLQHGFLLFELHRQLFNPGPSYDEEKAPFIGCLSYMEVAELRTVYDYL